jgi:hypothetical protein
MPYLEKGVRASLEEGRVPSEAGELNYLVTRLCDGFLMKTGLSYKNINQAIGALECAKLELYRRIAAPYEDQKCRDNGEVYVVNSRPS